MNRSGDVKKTILTCKGFELEFVSRSNEMKLVLYQQKVRTNLEKVIRVFALALKMSLLCD